MEFFVNLESVSLKLCSEATNAYFKLLYLHIQTLVHVYTYIYLSR